MRQILIKLAAFAPFALIAVPSIRASVPDWVREAAKVPVNVSDYNDETNAVVLLDEQTVRVNPNGELYFGVRRVVRILRPQGRDSGHMTVGYDKDVKVTNFKAYGINAKGQEFEANGKEAFESSYTSDDLYSDVRTKTLIAPADEPGSVVAFEEEERQRPYLHEYVWDFQGSDPVLTSRLLLILPSGWEYSSDMFNHEKVAPQQTPAGFLWEVKNVPRIHDEYRMPSLNAVAGRMTFHLYGPPATKISSWADVGAWHYSLQTGRRVPSPEMEQTVAQLTAAAPDFESKVRAVTQWMQRNVRYVSIQIGIGGWQPHPAPEIFRKKYGDCKDKATLLSTMLKTAGIDSEYVLIYSGDRTHVQVNNPTAFSFNHVITAIKLPHGEFKDAPAAFKDKSGQRWLLFDPTDEHLVLGHIETPLQGSNALLVRDGVGEMIQVPFLPPTSASRTSVADLKMNPDGSLSGDITQVYSGWNAEKLRGTLLDLPEAERKKALEHHMSEALVGVSVQNIDVAGIDAFDRDLTVKYSVKVSAYAKSAGPLLLLRPRVFGQYTYGIDRDQRPRQYAYEFEGVESRTDDFKITLPEGYSSDELPRPVDQDFYFGNYNSHSELKDNVLHYTRSMTIKQPEVQTNDIPQLRRFFHTIDLDERSSAVLKKAN